jgi:RNA polymerase sigma-70 factor (ECF subfamily)
MKPVDPAAGMEADQAQQQARLLSAIAQGDKRALGQLYDALAKPLYSLAYRVLNDGTEAQDIVHDVFVQIWHKAATYDVSRGTVFGWAATLTRNRAIDRVRTRKRRAELLTEFAPDLPAGSPESDQDSAASLWVQQKATTVRAALRQLAPDQQKAIELAFFGGCTQQEIAEKLNAPLGTIKARIRRGLFKLREILPDQL